MSSDIKISFLLQVENDSEVRIKFEAVTGSIEQLGEKSEKAAESADEVQVKYRDAATSLLGAAEKAFSLYTQFDNLERVELRIAEAEKNVNSARASLIDSQKALDELVEKGITTGSDYESAQLKVKAAEEELVIAKEKVAQAQGDLSQKQLDFALSVVPASVDVVSKLSKGLQELGLLTKITNIETGKTSFAFSTATLSMTAHKIAAGASTLATQGLALATKLFSLSMLPITGPLIAITTLLGLYATNAFGVRDSMNAMGKAIGDALPFLRPLLDGLASIANAFFPEAKEQAQDFGASTATSLQQVAEQYPEFATAAQQSAGSVVAGYEMMSAQAQNMQITTAGRLATMTSDVGANLTAQSAALQDLGVAAGDAGVSVGRSFDGMAAAAEKSAGRIVRASRKAADAMRSIGASKSSGSRTVQVKPAATGFSGIVTEPTLFLAGEAGPETVNIAPVRGAAAKGSAPIIITVITTLDGREVARAVSRHQAESM